MNEITLSMAAVDFFPVVLFFSAALLLLRDLYNKMVKGVFALLAAGSIMVLAGGFYKFLWKVFYALGACDYQMLNLSFFPLSGPGFMLVFLALLALLRRKKTDAKVLSAAAVPVFESSLVFILLQTVGCAGFQWCLFAIALRMGRKAAAALFVISFVLMMAMGVLSARFDDTAAMNWIAQCVNIAGNGALLIGVFDLHRAGLAGAGALTKREVSVCSDGQQN